MIKLNIFALNSKLEFESYEFVDKYLRKLPRKNDGTFDRSSDDFDDNDVDAIRHTYTSGIFTQEYGERVTEILGELNELIPLGGNSSSRNPNSKKMDLWNNAVGRKLGKKTSGKLKLFKLILKSLKNNELIIDPEHDPRISTISDKPSNDIKKWVIVIKESKKGKNLSYLDVSNMLILTRQEFVSEINLGKYSKYEIRNVRGEEIPVSKKDKVVPNNLDS